MSRAIPGDWTVIEALFDHVPDTVFFVKDAAGRYLSVNETFVNRCKLKGKSDITGRRAEDLFPPELATRYSSQDAAVLRAGRPITSRLEMHWRENRRIGWCLTTKLPLRDARGAILGLAGISRDVGTPGDVEAIPASLARTLEFLEENLATAITPSSLAKHANIAPARFAKIIKKIFHLTPGQLISQTRLAAAARMLEHSDRAIAEIAIDCGFYDHSAFTRAFRLATGKTPSQFRGHRQAGGKPAW